MYTVHDVHSFLIYHVSHLCLPTVIQLLVGQAQCTNYCTVDSAHNYARCVHRLCNAAVQNIQVDETQILYSYTLKTFCGTFSLLSSSSLPLLECLCGEANS